LSHGKSSAAEVESTTASARTATRKARASWHEEPRGSIFFNCQVPVQLSYVFVLLLRHLPFLVLHMSNS
jgi:hypothetical protein